MQEREEKEACIWTVNGSFINFYTGVPFQCLANEFKLLFMRAFFPVIEGFFIF